MRGQIRYDRGMDDLLKFFRDHKLAILGIAAFVYVAKFVCSKSMVLFDILVLVAGSLVLVTIYRYRPNESDAEMRKSFRRRNRRRHRTRR
jgi:hypothetical protein